MVYTKQVIIHDTIAPLIDLQGYVYHTVSLDDDDCVYDNTLPVLGFALMLPNTCPETGETQYCVVDKDWQFIGKDKTWTYLG